MEVLRREGERIDTEERCLCAHSSKALHSRPRKSHVHCLGYSVLKGMGGEAGEEMEKWVVQFEIDYIQQIIKTTLKIRKARFLTGEKYYKILKE
jgi:hypothetical protein